jgi:hypothetical protein
MEESERKIWWHIVNKCWSQDPLARPSMDKVSEMLFSLRKSLFERIQGLLISYLSLSLSQFLLLAFFVLTSKQDFVVEHTRQEHMTSF